MEISSSVCYSPALAVVKEMEMKRLLLVALIALPALLALSSGTASAAPPFGTNVNITKQGGNQAEGTIAINPNNPSQVFFASNSGATTRRSVNGGSTWIAAGAGIAASCCDNVASWDTFG